MPTNPPYVAQGRTDHPAVLFRMALAGVAGGPVAVGATSPGGGVNPVLGSRLTPSGLSSMAVQIGTGLCYIPNSTAWNGMYACYNTAATNVNINASSSTQWRRDYIIAQVVDPGDNTAAWSLTNVTGTFSSTSPGNLPALPSNCIPLAIVNVVPNMSVTSGAGTVTDARPFQPLPGPIPTTSSNKPPLTVPEGTMWFETDTNLLGIVVNGAYSYIPTGAQVDVWHTIAPFNGWTASSQTPRYRLTNDGELELNGAVNGGSATAAQFFTLPAGWRPLNTQTYGCGATAGVIAGQGPFIQINNNGQVIAEGVNPGTSAMTVNISGRIPMN